MYAPTWIAADGTVWDLNPDNDAGIFSLKAVGGIGAVPREVVSDPDPAGGVTVRQVPPQPRVITWPLRFRSRTHMGLLNLWRGYANAFAATDQDNMGVLRLSRPDGSAREIPAILQAGFEIEPSGDGLWLEDTEVLSLFCPDPYWRDAELAVARRTPAEPVDFLDPFPSVSSGQVLGVTTINNAGDVDAWPQWTLTGPMTSLVATNSTVGQSFTLTFALAAGQQITITTRPPTVLGPAGTSILSALNLPVGKLWRLAKGSNAVTFTAHGADSDTTAVELTFYPRYRTA